MHTLVLQTTRITFKLRVPHDETTGQKPGRFTRMRDIEIYG